MAKNVHAFTDANFDSDVLKSSEPVLVDFTATWCGPCKKLSPIVEALADELPGHFDVVTCMEMLEHVPDPASIVAACARLVKPGGHVFLSTLNRNPKSYLFAIVGAEYLLKLLPAGTHEYARFIKPSELSRHCRNARLDVREIIGLSYNPLAKTYSLGRDTDVNYLVHTVAAA